MVNLHTLDEGADEIPLTVPIELLQSTLYFGTKLFQPTDDQLEIGLGLSLCA